MIFLFDSVAWGPEHVPFNAAFLGAVREAFPDEPVRFYGERDHLGHLRQFGKGRLPDDGPAVEWHEMALPPRFASGERRLKHDWQNCHRVLSEAALSPGSRVIACNLYPTTGLAALKARRLIDRSSTVALVHHGGLRGLMGSRRHIPLLTLGNGRLRQIVLANAIRGEIVRRLPSLGASVHAIRHPYFFDHTPVSELPAEGPITFAYLGLVDKEKGFPVFSQLAATVAASAWSRRARFELIGFFPKKEGSSSNGAEARPGPWVETAGQAGHLPRAVYEARLQQMSYSVLPYNPSEYAFVPSGSVLDTLAVAKPLIAIANPQFEEMFRDLGDIGYLCKDAEEMREVILAIAREPPRERYRRQSEAILAGRQIYGPSAVATQLRDILAT